MDEEQSWRPFEAWRHFLDENALILAVVLVGSLFFPIFQAIGHDDFIRAYAVYVVSLLFDLIRVATIIAAGVSAGAYAAEKTKLTVIGWIIGLAAAGAVIYVTEQITDVFPFRDAQISGYRS